MALPSVLSFTMGVYAEGRRATRRRPSGQLWLLGLGALLQLSSCFGGSSSSSQAMEIQACSLGCSSAFIGGQFSCGITDIAVNQEIRVVFSSPIDLGSVSNDTFQVVETTTGVTPPASFRLDPNDPRVVIYRPNLSFDSGGNPVFGLTEGGSYRIRIPGSEEDPGPYIRSQDGRSNATRMSCFVLASQGVSDAKPGRYF